MASSHTPASVSTSTSAATASTPTPTSTLTLRHGLSEYGEDEATMSGRSKVPPWIPIAGFVGTSLAVAIPLLMVRRQRVRGSSVHMAVGAAPPPRRRIVVSPTSGSSASTSPFPPITTTSSSETQTQNLNLFESPHTSEGGPTSLMHALSQMNKSSGLLALKALGVATFLVGVTAWVGVKGVMGALGVDDAHQFGTRMRTLMWSFFPRLTARIHRSPNSDSDDQSMHLFPELAASTSSSSASSSFYASSSSSSAHDANTSMEQSPKLTLTQKLARAYDEGGISLWAAVAMKEVEDEARVEREKRERVGEVEGKGNKE